METLGSIAKRYHKLSSDRASYITRAENCAGLTIPSLFPPGDQASTNDMRETRQSIGARCVNVLSAKMLLTLLPPNQPFFRYVVDESDLADVSEETYGKVEEVLVSIEQLSMTMLDRKKPRPVAHESLKQLLVAGNALLKYGEDKVKLYRLNKYVVKRNGNDDVIEIIIEEDIDREQVPKHLQAAVAPAMGEPDDKPLKLYTQVKLQGNHWVLQQEIKGVLDPQARSTFPKDKNPYVPLRMIRVDGEDYGRSYVEEYSGDLRAYEGLSKAINEGTAAAARLLFMVRANSTTKLQELVAAPNGGFVSGNEEDITTLKIDKHADFGTARQRLGELKEDLSAAFLLNSSVTRQAERVTATEIRILAQELEVALGGIYALLTAEFQLPIVNLILAELQKKKMLPRLPEGFLKPTALTGIEALGRTQELEKLRQYLELMEPFGPEALQEGIHVTEYSRRVAAALAIDTNGLVPTDAERSQRKQQEDMKQLAQMMGPEAMKQMQGGPPVG